MTEHQLLTLIVIVAVAALVIVILRQPGPAAGGSPASAKTILLGLAVLFFVLTGIGVFPGTAWGLACLATAFLL